jgi:hypothetical protein
MRSEHEAVRLKREVSGVPKGTLGTVVMVSPTFPSQSLVEFPDPKGKEILLVTVDETDLEEGEAVATSDDLRVLSEIWDVNKYKE